MDKYSISDLVSQSYLSIDFPAQFIATMKTKGLENVTIRDFYRAFCKKNEVSPQDDKNIIFNPASILGHLYVSFLLPQQDLFDSISEKEISPDEWGFCVTKVKGDENQLKNIAKGMRNSIAHGHFYISKSFDFVFWDVVPPKTDIGDAHTIYKFSFDGLNFKFLPKWMEVITPLLINS